MLRLNKPIVMGILNVTPDSFYSSSMLLERLLIDAEKMLRDGATILDIGGASSKPGAKEVPIEEEIERVIPVIQEIKARFPDTWISVDTCHAEVALLSVSSGADIVNDITAGRDPKMLETVARLGVPYIAMHMQGTPRDMQIAPHYEHATSEVFAFLKAVVVRCEAAGIRDLILDPGFGFGKTVAHNFQILEQFSCFSILGKPLLAGLSRKSMICKTLGVNPDNALNGTTALNMVALREGANILRVHDVKEAMETIQLCEQIKAQ